MSKKTAAKRMSSYPDGYRVIPDALTASTLLTSNAKLVMLFLAEKYNEELKVAWPSLGTIATNCGLGDKTAAKRAIRQLVKLGWVEIIPEDQRRHRSVEYRIRWQKFDADMGSDRKRQLESWMKRHHVEIKRIMKDGTYVLSPDAALHKELKENFDPVFDELERQLQSEKQKKENSDVKV